MKPLPAVDDAEIALIDTVVVLIAVETYLCCHRVNERMSGQD